MDERRFGELAALFTPDARFTTFRGRRVDGRESLVALWSKRPPAPGRHCATNIVVDIFPDDGTRAVAGSDIIFVGRQQTGPVAVTAVARYDDLLIATNDGWRLASRKVSLLGEES